MPTPTNPASPGSGGSGSTPGTGGSPAPATGGAPAQRTYPPAPPLPPSQRTLWGRMSNRVSNMSGHMIAISVIICLMFLLAVIMFTNGYQPPKTRYAYEFNPKVTSTNNIVERSDTEAATEKEQAPATPPSPSEVLERAAASTATSTAPVINPPPQRQSKGVTGPVSVLSMPSGGKGDMLVTNAIGAGGIAVISSGGSNTITVIGRDYNTGGFNGGQNANSWPANTKPTRLEKVLPDSRLSIGQTNDMIVEIKSGEDVLFELPRNWNVQTYPEQNAGRFSVAIDNHDVSSEDSSSLVNAQTVRFWNRSNQSFRLGIRCIKLKEDPFWGR